MAIPILFAALFTALAGAAYVTNPFSRLSIIKRPFVVELALGSLQAIDNNHRLVLRQQWWWRVFAVLKCGIHILSTRYVRSPRSRSTTVAGIIKDIHQLRFNPQRLLLTSGDHYSGLFVRNLGVFYYPMLDTRVAGSKTDWHNRQVVYLQTVAYALGVFAKQPVPTTTIVPTGRYAATCVNFYAYPSDTVYGMLYALAALVGQESALPGEDYGSPAHALATQPAAHVLLREYGGTLRTLYAHYRRTVFDDQTGLIRMDIHLSGAKDITRRSCSFYDNVIFWKTTRLAMELGIIPWDKPFLRQLKSCILQTFWLEKQGCFLEDLSEEGTQCAYYSSDWLIVLATGFLRPSHKTERHYYERSVQYIQKHSIDQPFALKYQPDTRAHRQFLLVRLTVASYGGDAIWSFWGMEYIKALVLLYKYTGDTTHLKAADKHIAAYEQAMLRDGGFPEVYDRRGQLLQTPIYRSIRQTGWVIGFEQAKTMRASVKTTAKKETYAKA